MCLDEPVSLSVHAIRPRPRRRPHSKALPSGSGVAGVRSHLQAHTMLERLVWRRAAACVTLRPRRRRAAKAARWVPLVVTWFPPKPGWSRPTARPGVHVQGGAIDALRSVSRYTPPLGAHESATATRRITSRPSSPTSSRKRFRTFASNRSHVCIPRSSLAPTLSRTSVRRDLADYVIYEPTRRLREQVQGSRRQDFSAGRAVPGLRLCVQR